MPGLQFYKVDLHTHTPASKCYLKKDHTAEHIVDTAIAKGLDAIAITDHNTAAWIDTMKAVSLEKDLVIFPGVEISVHEGFHVVALFDPNVDQKHVEGFLGGIGIKADDHGKHDALCTKSVYDVVNIIHDYDGLAILAHIDQPKGAFQELAVQRDGKKHIPLPLTKLMNEAEYDAVECAKGIFPELFDEAHNFKRFPAMYQASDNPDPDQPSKHSCDGLGALYSWFKLDQIDIEGLRQCFSDPEVRIALMGDYEEVGYPKIVSMEIGDTGFLRYQKFNFHNGLNSLIGGKGVGKSLAVEFLRFGLEQVSSDRNLYKDHIGKLDKRLEQENSIKIVYQLANGTQYELERVYRGKERGDDGDIPLSDGKCTNLSTGEEYVGDVPTIFPILAYSQTEVIKITENKEAQLELIDRFIDSRPHEQEISEIQEKLGKNDRNLSQAIQARDRLDACEKDTQTLGAQIESINKSLSDPLFDTMKSMEAKKQEFENRQVFVDELIQNVRSWIDQVKDRSVRDLPEEFEGDKDLQKQQSVAEAAKTQVLDNLNSLIDTLKSSSDNIGSDLEKWFPKFEKVESEYAELLRSIGGDREEQEKERKKLEKQKTKLDDEANGYRSLIKDLEKLINNRDELLNSLERSYREYYDLRKSKYDQLSEFSEEKLRLELEHAVDRSEYEKKLMTILRGGDNAPTTSDRRKIAANILPRRFVKLALDRNTPHMAEEADITELWAQRVIEKLWAHDDFTKVLALQHNCYPTDMPSIRFKKGDKQYDELGELSVGQKCTALLIIALCDGAMPIVIDQPEDALDIMSVWEDISKKLRRGKNARQFILTTHNSSVAVASDSDQFIVMRATANSGKVIASGAIDRPDVRKAVIDHLEGGDVPYKLRSLKYNIQ